MASILVLLKDDQHKTLKAAAAQAGFGLGPWLRGLGIAAARNMGISSETDQRRAERAAHAAGVAERRAKREARRQAVAEEDEAWAKLARAQEAESIARTGGDPVKIEAAYSVRIAADAAAVAAQEKRKALEA